MPVTPELQPSKYDSSTMSAISRFSIDRDPPVAGTKRDKEIIAIRPLLLRLDQFVKLDDVMFGQDPPDFVFRHNDKEIGVELTDLVPKLAEKGGHRQRGAFRKWQAAIDRNSPARHEFQWEDFTLGGSLAAFQSQLIRKCLLVDKWQQSFAENWLLMHMDKGGPLSEVVVARKLTTPGHEDEVGAYFAKATQAVHSICQTCKAFHRVILFNKTKFLTFPTGDANPWNLPVPSTDILARGEKASDEFLEWKSSPHSFVEHRKSWP